MNIDLIKPILQAEATTGEAGNQNMWLMMLVVLIPIGIFIWFRHKKQKNEEGSKVVSGKRKKQESEAWVTIKKYLKDQNETGKEIVELFVVKRIEEQDVSSLPTKELRQQQKLENKKKKDEMKALKAKDPEKYKKLRKEEKSTKKPELWLLYFVTRNPKTKENDKARIIECKIEYKKISKKTTDRVIHVNDKVNFKKEMEWIKPIKDKEDQITLKNEAVQAKKMKRYQERQAKKAANKKQKAEAKKEKAKGSK